LRGEGIKVYEFDMNTHVEIKKDQVSQSIAHDSSRSRVGIEDDQESEEEKLWKVKLEPIVEAFKHEMQEKLTYLQYFFPSEDNEKQFIEK
jgi:hypothetical protein